MKIQHHIHLLNKLAGLMAVAGASVLIISTGAQSQGILNPRPSIFNEPPYNRGGSTPQSPQVSPSMPSMPSEGSTTSPSMPPMPGEGSTTSPSMPPTPGSTEPTSGTPRENVVALAAANGSFKTLTAALKAAGLTQTLSGTGPFTVFAPTDAAFAALPQNALQELLKPENKEVLVKILTYHVVPGKVESSDLKTGKVKTVEGGSVNVKVNSPTSVMVDDAKVVQPDIQASNGVIHVIDKVILPPDL